MIDCGAFCERLEAHDIDFFTGVPDSLLKDFCAYVDDHGRDGQHLITANEGAAVALAAGYHLATGRTGLVYMQNSGQGNIVNPLTSLVDHDVYGIPVLLLVGWRGEPGVKDEPQHVKQGKITLTLFETLGVPYTVLPDDVEPIDAILTTAVASMKERSMPYALVVRKGTFHPYKPQRTTTPTHPMLREEALRLVVDTLDPRDIIVSTTGKTSRELFELRQARGEGHGADFLTVGSMGHASQIALGIAMQQPDRRIYCIDGDGAVVMHMGSLAIIGSVAPPNYRHVIINNGAHDSVGGQPTVGFVIDIPAIASACGYRAVYRAETADEVPEGMSKLQSATGPALLEIRVRTGARPDLGRPTTTPQQNKTAFMEFLAS